MANKRISALDDITVVGGTSTAEVNANDILPITDVDDTTGSPQGTTKGVTVADLMGAAPVQPAGIANMVETTDSINVLADVDTSTTPPTTTDFLKWGGSNWVPAVPTADVDGPLTTALRGTDNPHIGAYPNQSFKVTDNPNKSVMVLADADGNLEFMTKDGANVFVNTPSSRLALAKGFSIQADGAEPDIEAVDTDGTTYSVISGDTDTKGANGLPTRQGFNLPDIGANPAPILISGGTIA